MLKLPRARYLSTLVIALLAAACTRTDTTTDTPQRFDRSQTLTQLGIAPEKIGEIDALLQSYVDDHKTGSVAALVAKDGKVVYADAFGWRDRENRVPASLDDYYVLFSQTKAVTTVAFMTLVEQGLVDIHDPVADYFPGISDQVLVHINDDGSYETRPVASPMTFAHLMAHTSGLYAGLAGEARRADTDGSGAPLGFGGQEPEFQISGQRTGGGNFAAPFLEDEMLVMAGYPLGFDPGTQWNYHVSTNMLGYLVERISGQPLRDYVRETILDPLGMDQTDWFYAPEALERFVRPYSAVDGELVPGSTVYIKGAVSSEQTYAEGAIGLNGPIEDYAKFAQMLLNKGTFNGQRILQPDTVERMTTINRLPGAEEGEEDFRFGLGFELYHEDKKPAPEVSNSAYAWGGMLGTEYIIDPEENLIALFYINMYQREPLYPAFLSKAYQLFEE
ncbi:serine hydrolase domain-containing protein [Marinimicrobium alkaliphilum]|uniref:serine hydrolase domain-containing protein n=1 Tax=Marinimicrobium alkaliphilum TaxID=2202654 RepID=UPI000DBA7503|nr:serine hydrolase domain-containing protein [Marinimicrobium alkaliphilum]